MTVLTFPSNPIEGQVYNAPNGIRYVYDGVKWVVETTTSTSEAVTNSMQDRVAPMFVNGDHEGISFSYNATTNALSATVTAVNGNRLVNGVHEVVLNSSGTLELADDIKLPTGGRWIKDCGNSGTTTSMRWINIPTTQEVQLFRAYTGDPAASGSLERGAISIEWPATNVSGVSLTAFDRTSGAISRKWLFNGNGKLQLPAGGDIVDSTGTSVLGGGGSGDRLVNGQTEFILNANGTITLPTLSTRDYEDDGNVTGQTLKIGSDPNSQAVITGPTPTNDIPNAPRIIIQGQQGFGGEDNNKGWGADVFIHAGAGGDGGSVDPRGEGGDVEIRGGYGGINGGYVNLYAGNSEANNGFGGNIELRAGGSFGTNARGGNVTIRGGYGNNDGGNVEIHGGDRNGGNNGNFGTVSVNTGNGGWEFKPNNSFSISSGEVHIATNNWGITALADAVTVVYTAKQNDLASIRVHATIEGVEDGDNTGNHTQACDMMIVRRSGDTVIVDSVVYGVIYTGTGPLATLDARWNATSSKIEITATPISTTNGVYVKIYATEVARGD